MPKRKNRPEQEINGEQKRPVEIKSDEEPLNNLKTVKAELLGDFFTQRTRSERKSALKAYRAIKSCLTNEEIEPNVPRIVRRKPAVLKDNLQEDKPDLVDISELHIIKQEEDYINVDPLLEAEDNESNKNDRLLDFSGTEFLEMDIKEKDSGVTCRSINKIFLKTDEILGIKSLKRPTVGPQQIGGSVDAKDSKFKIKCDHCSEQFHTKFRFNSHLQKVHNINKEECVLQCKYCPQRSKTTYNLKSHMLMYHLDELNFKTKWYKCSKCYLTSTDSDQIQMHKEESIWCQGAIILLFHTCTECPFRTDRVSKLQGHIKWHFKFGGLKCPHCTFKCPPSQEKMMTEHLLLHKT